MQTFTVPTDVGEIRIVACGLADALLLADAGEGGGVVGGEGAGYLGSGDPSPNATIWPGSYQFGLVIIADDD